MTERKSPFACYDRRYAREVAPGLVAMTLFLVLLVNTPKGTWARYAVSVLVGLATAWVIGVTVASIRRLDELERQIHLQAIAFSFALTASVATLLGYLESAGLSFPRWAAWAWPFMALVWALGVVVLRRRYR